MGALDGVRIAVLAGGLSFEREASLLSGHHVANTLTDAGHDVRVLEPDADLLDRLDEFDVAFMSVHGRLGEDGTLQSMLDLARVPYTGARATASSLSWDKPVAKAVLEREGLLVAPSVQFAVASLRELGAARLIKHVEGHIELPVVVKPASGGSALGVSRVDEMDQLTDALMHALSYSDVVMVEDFVEGTEVGVSILADRTLPPVEVVPAAGMYDYAARYTHAGAEYFAPARLPQDVLDACVDAAERAHAALGGRHLGRLDLIVDADGRPVVLEYATCPGLTDQSLLPLAADAVGVGFTAALEDVLEAALQEG